jgi:threonyl-tRNA synthetase
MRSIVREGQEFKQFSLSVADAKALVTALGEIYKLEMIEDLEARGETTISFFANIGKFQNPVYASFEFLNNPMTIAGVANGEVSVPHSPLEGQGVDAPENAPRPVTQDTPHEGKQSNFDFRTSTFIDMCQGPHVQYTNTIPEDAFKLDKLAGAYWR